MGLLFRLLSVFAAVSRPAVRPLFAVSSGLGVANRLKLTGPAKPVIIYGSAVWFPSEKFIAYPNTFQEVVEACRMGCYMRVGSHHEHDPALCDSCGNGRFPREYTFSELSDVYGLLHGTSNTQNCLSGSVTG